MDMDYKKVYEEWLTNPFFDEATRQELAAIKDDEKEIKERFYTDLEFGTAGLRGIIGAGTNRMNNYIVAKATQGLANYIKQRKKHMREALRLRMIQTLLTRALQTCSKRCVWQQTVFQHIRV